MVAPGVRQQTDQMDGRTDEWWRFEIGNCVAAKSIRLLPGD